MALDMDVDEDGHRCFFPIYNTRMDFSPIQSVSGMARVRFSI